MFTVGVAVVIVIATAISSRSLAYLVEIHDDSTDIRIGSAFLDTGAVGYIYHACLTPSLPV